MFQQGDFVNPAGMTPEELRRKRERLAASQPRYGRARYVGEGWGHLASGIAQGLAGRRLDKQEREARAEAGDLFSRIMGGASGSYETSLFGRMSTSAPTAGDFNPAAEDQAEAMGLDMGKLTPKQRDTVPAPNVIVDPNLDDDTWMGLASGAGGLDMGRNAVDPKQRDLLAKTLMAEAGGEGLEGMVAAGSVINNRLQSGRYGNSLDDVIMAPGQFSAWNSVTGYAGGEGGLDMGRMTPSEEAYRAADMLLSGNYEDPTGGATHYYNPSVANPKWGAGAGGDWRRIGNHIFGNADGRPGAGGSGGTQYAQAGNIRNDAGPSQADLMAVLSNPWMTPQQRQVAETMLTQRMQANDPMRQLQMQKAQLELDRMQNPPADNQYIKGLGIVDMNTGNIVSDFDGKAGEIGGSDGDGDMVRSSEILDDGTVIQSTDGGVKVYGPNGQLLTGQEAADAVLKAREFTVQNQRDIYAGRRTGTNTAEAETGGAAAAAGSLGAKQGDFVEKAFNGADAVAGSIGNINTAISALDAGARSGAIDRYIPNITEASATLRNSMDRMGLDVIGSVTFGALSEGELRLAMETAVPRNLNEAELRSWLVKKRDAQQKVRVALIEQAQFLSKPENSLEDWANKLGKDMGQEGQQGGAVEELQSQIQNIRNFSEMSDEELDKWITENGG